MKTWFVVLLVCVLFVGCAKDGKPVEVQGAIDNYKVEFLFEKDGIRVYRFADDGRYHYFTSHGEAMTTQGSKYRWEENVR